MSYFINKTFTGRFIVILGGPNMTRFQNLNTDRFDILTGFPGLYSVLTVQNQRKSFS